MYVRGFFFDANSVSFGPEADIVEAGCLATSQDIPCRLEHLQGRTSEHPLLRYLRSDLKPARTSSEKSCGCSHAAKCPPLGSLL